MDAPENSDLPDSPEPIDQEDPQQAPRPVAGLWARAFFPFSYMVPLQGSEAEVKSALRRNADFMEKHGFTYIMRWGILYAIATWLVAGAHDLGDGLLLDLTSGVLYCVLAIALYMVYFRWSVISRQRRATPPK